MTKIRNKWCKKLGGLAENMFLCVFSEVPTCDSDDLDEMERIRKDHIEALREIKRLQVKFIIINNISLCTVDMQMVCAGSYCI